MFEVNLFDNYFEEQERLSIKHVQNICNFVYRQLNAREKLDKTKISKDEIFSYIISYLETSDTGITSMELQKILSNLKQQYD